LTVAAPDVQATGKAIMTLTGNVDAGVYVAVAGIPADISNQTWSAAVTLNPGLNTIEVQAIDLTGQISSQKRTVFYNATAPDLAITAPAEDVITSKKSVTITGKVTDGSGVAVSAEVNGIPKKVTVDDGRFNLPVEFPEEGSYTVNLYGSIGGNVSTISRTIVYRKAP
jgi:multidrug efflux pump subunit AcrA (membrane-fusion protein)